MSNADSFAQGMFDQMRGKTGKGKSRNKKARKSHNKRARILNNDPLFIKNSDPIELIGKKKGKMSIRDTARNASHK